MRTAIVIAANGPAASDDRLKFAESDGDRFAQILEQPLCGYQVRRVPGDTTASEARQIIMEGAESCGPGDVFLTYFAGHGKAHKGDLLLTLNGARDDKPNSTFLAASDLIKAFRDCQAGNRILILDCCNAGGLARQQGVRTRGGTPVRELGIESETFNIVMAANFLEQAYEDPEFGGGFLTFALHEALTTRFTEADSDNDRALSFEEAMSWLARRASEVNESRSQDRKIPVPVRLGFGKGVGYLTRPPREWIVHEIELPNGTPAVVLPIAPMAVRHENDITEFAFAMARHPVTNRDYRLYVESTGRHAPAGIRPSAEELSWRERQLSPWEEDDFKDPDMPVVCVEYGQALAYCRWMSGLKQEHGFLTVLPPLPEMWNIAVFDSFYESTDPRKWMAVSQVIHHRSAAPAPCVAAPERTSVLGLTDLVGNVWEWCANKGDWIVGLQLDEKTRENLNYYERFWKGLAYMDMERIPSSFWQWLHKKTEAIERILKRELRGGGFSDDLKLVRPFISVGALPQHGQGALISRSNIGFRLAAAIKLDHLPADVAERLYGRSSLSDILQEAIVHGSAPLDFGDDSDGQ